MLAMPSERVPHDDGRLSPMYLSDNFFLDLYAVLGKETYSSIKGVYIEQNICYIAMGQKTSKGAKE
jgi:hypothetical protein